MHVEEQASLILVVMREGAGCVDRSQKWVHSVIAVCLIWRASFTHSAALQPRPLAELHLSVRDRNMGRRRDKFEDRTSTFLSPSVHEHLFLSFQRQYQALTLGLQALTYPRSKS